MTDHHEVEDKFDVDDGTPLPSLAGLQGVASVGSPVEHDLEATYFDTADLALTAAGITLRRRTGGDDPGWHLKLPTAEDRYEVQVPLGRSTRTPPIRMRSRVQAIVRGERLAPIAIVRNRRVAHRLLDSEGRILAEVSEDMVSATDSYTATATAWREWEVELVDGDGVLLLAAAEALLAGGATRSRSPSKLARALGDRMPAEPEPGRPSPRRKGPAEHVVHDRLVQQVSELRRLDPLVRSDATDAVHKMRVAIRRLRNALATFGPLLDREVTDPVRAELKWLAAVLGDVRDAEVMHHRLQAMLADESPEIVRGVVRSRTDKELGERRRAAHARAVLAMETERYFALLDRLNGLAAGPPWNEVAREPASEVLPGCVLHDWKRLRRRVAAAADVDDPVERARRLHEVRKAAKRTRYATEALTPVYRKDARRLRRATKRIQTVLGAHHDSIVTQVELRQLADRAAADGENAFTLGVLHAREEAGVAKAEAQFTKAWRAASSKKLQRWLR